MIIIFAGGFISTAKTKTIIWLPSPLWSAPWHRPKLCRRLCGTGAGIRMEAFLIRAGREQWAEKGFVASEKALALDPDLAVAHLARGRLLWTPANHFPHEKVIQEYRRALALDPSLDEARNQLALVYCHIGLLTRRSRNRRKQSRSTLAITWPNSASERRYISRASMNRP